MTEGSFTKNSAEEVDEMMKKLELWSNSATRPPLEECLRLSALKVPLKATSVPIDIQRFMGRWYVLASMPTSFEIGASNCIENYSWNEGRKAVDIHFEFVPAGSKSGTYSDMRGSIVNEGVNTQWSLSPKLLSIYWPLGITYLVLYTAEDYSYTIVGVPDRKYLWIMTRLKPAIEVPQDISASVSPAAATAASAPVAGEVPAASHSTTVAAHEALSPVREGEIMREALHKAEQLGYDVSKVKRNIWTI
jgi:apolipoprotein D and lipocalin family protein